MRGECLEPVRCLVAYLLADLPAESRMALREVFPACRVQADVAWAFPGAPRAGLVRAESRMVLRVDFLEPRLLAHPAQLPAECPGVPDFPVDCRVLRGVCPAQSPVPREGCQAQGLRDHREECREECREEFPVCPGRWLAVECCLE